MSEAKHRDVVAELDHWIDINRRYSRMPTADKLLIERARKEILAQREWVAHWQRRFDLQEARRDEAERHVAALQHGTACDAHWLAEMLRERDRIRDEALECAAAICDMLASHPPPGVVMRLDDAMIQAAKNIRALKDKRDE